MNGGDLRNPFVIKGEQVMLAHTDDPVYTQRDLEAGVDKIHDRYGLSGDGIVIYIVDNGWIQHNDLGVPTDLENFVPGETIADGGDHGMAVGASFNLQGKQILGSAPGVEIRIAKFMNAQGSGSFSVLNQALIKIETTIIQERAAGINKMVFLNFAFGANEQANDASTNTITQRLVNEHNVLIGASSGNESRTDVNGVGYPARLPWILALGSIGLNKVLSFFSNQGTVLQFVDYGEGILLTDTDGVTYRRWSGTSFSLPSFLGKVALICEAFRETFGRWPHVVNELIPILIDTAEDLGDAGKDKSFGNGLLTFDCIKNDFAYAKEELGIEIGEPMPVVPAPEPPDPGHVCPKPPTIEDLLTEEEIEGAEVWPLLPSGLQRAIKSWAQRFGSAENKAVSYGFPWFPILIIVAAIVTLYALT
jgi:subtilisin family serine protease